MSTGQWKNIITYDTTPSLAIQVDLIIDPVGAFSCRLDGEQQICFGSREDQE
jgi:hypothetical protein